MKTVDITYGEYASKWGLTDFYEESDSHKEAYRRMFDCRNHSGFEG